MPEPRFDDDDLAFRLSALSHASEQTDGPGLADVHRRRGRRQRRLAATTGLAAVTAVAAIAVAVAVVAPFGTPTAAPPAGPSGGVASGTPARSTTSTTSSATPTTSSTSPSTVLTAESLVTRTELTAAAVPVVSDDLGDPDGQPSLPPFCGGTSWTLGYSGPASFRSGSFDLTGGTLAVDLLSYDSDVAANAALVGLKEDARACPVVNEFASVEVTAVGSAIGDEFVIFRLDTESGQDGSIRPVWVTIARTGDVLVSAAVSQDDVQEAQDNRQVSRDAAQAGVDHLSTG